MGAGKQTDAHRRDLGALQPIQIKAVQPPALRLGYQSRQWLLHDPSNDPNKFP